MKHLLTLMALCTTYYAGAQDGCPEPLDSNGDGLIGVEDLMNVLTHFGDSDLDQDGVFDSVDDCIGQIDECGVCNGQGIPEGYCTCSLIIDALGECGGDCALDENDDGICDEYFGPCFGSDVLMYHDYQYELIAIGNNCWFAENLRSDAYSDGESIAIVQDEYDWRELTTPACCIKNDLPENFESFGYIYNGYVLSDSMNVCPAGWHVSTESDWQDLEISIGMDSSEVTTNGWGGWRGEEDTLALKLKSDIHWNGTNESGFSGLSGACRDTEGNYFFSMGYFGNGGLWWAHVDGQNGGFNRYVHQDEPGIYRSARSGRWGFYIRCVKD